MWNHDQEERAETLWRIHCIFHVLTTACSCNAILLFLTLTSDLTGRPGCHGEWPWQGWVDQTSVWRTVWWPAAQHTLHQQCATCQQKETGQKLGTEINLRERHHALIHPLVDVDALQILFLESLQLCVLSCVSISLCSQQMAQVTRRTYLCDLWLPVRGKVTNLWSTCSQGQGQSAVDLDVLLKVIIHKSHRTVVISEIK